MIENVGVAVGIALPVFSVQSYFHFRFPLPVRGRRIRFQCWSRSGRVGSVFLRRAWSKLWGSRWNSLAMCFRSKVNFTSGFPLPVVVADICVSGVGRCRAGVGSVISK